MSLGPGSATGGYFRLRAMSIIAPYAPAVDVADVRRRVENVLGTR
jgi:hypothetical protein